MNLIELQHALRQLRLGGIATVLETRLHQAQAEAMAPIDLISCLVADELTRRGDRLLERRRKQAAFRDPQKTLDHFDFTFNPKMNRSLVFDLATCAFIDKREDALFLGPASQKHNAHGPEKINIHYRFHPLFGQRLRVERRAKLASGEYIFCELPDGTIGGFPSWITDPATNANVSVGAPLTSAAALAELRTLLDSLHSNSPRRDASLLKIRREGTNDTKENAGENPDEPIAL